MRVLRLDLNSNSWKIEDTAAQGPVTLGVRIHNEAKTWNLDPLDPSAPFILGMGPFIGGKMPGFHRLIAVFKSPMTRTLHVAALGGAAYKFMGAGIDAVVITGRARKPVVVFMSSDGIELKDTDPVFEYGGYHAPMPSRSTSSTRTGTSSLSIMQGPWLWAQGRSARTTVRWCP